MACLPWLLVCCCSAMGLVPADGSAAPALLISAQASALWDVHGLSCLCDCAHTYRSVVELELNGACCQCWPLCRGACTATGALRLAVLRIWPLTQLAEQALVSVASRFLETLPECDKDTRENIAYHMAFAHEEVAAASLRYLRD